MFDSCSSKHYREKVNKSSKKERKNESKLIVFIVKKCRMFRNYDKRRRRKVFYASYFDDQIVNCHRKFTEGKFSNVNCSSSFRHLVVR